MPSKPIATVILAAGESRRMGCPKQLLRFGNTTLIQHAIESALSANLGPAFLVLGANAKTITAQINQRDVKLVLNENWDAGMHTSIRCGIEALETQQPDSAAAILMNCDQPYITRQTLRSLAAAFHASAPSAVASHYAGTNGTPALFSATLFNRLKTLNSGGAKHLLKELGREVISLDFSCGEIDIDTPADYIHLAASSARESAIECREFVNATAIVFPDLWRGFFCASLRGKSIPICAPNLERSCCMIAFAPKVEQNLPLLDGSPW